MHTLIKSISILFLLMLIGMGGYSLYHLVTCAFYEETSPFLFFRGGEGHMMFFPGGMHLGFSNIFFIIVVLFALFLILTGIFSNSNSRERLGRGRKK